ncbi:MAG TPA: hypothetical protein VKM54_13445 [Myxococcota bacterium]|nr:hypothetical protein [Myxococcota bacterium]
MSEGGTRNAPHTESAGALPLAPQRRGAAWQRLLPWGITAVCFFWLYRNVSAAAARQHYELIPYLLGIFERVDWGSFLVIVIPYSLFYFAIDSLVLYRVVNWFNARVSYMDILPVRASTYILSIVNEQVGKGAMAVYLHRREGVPGWQVGSSMLFIMFCEFYYLLAWATFGVALRWDSLPPVFHAIPAVALGAALWFVFHLLYFNGSIFPNSTLRNRQLLHAFRKAKPWQYATIVLLRSPALLAGVVAYTLVMRLFGVTLGFGQVLGYLPVVFFGAAVPGPMRAVAITLWTVLVPEHAGEMAAFGLVMHNFFIFFNAAIGLLFLRRAQREIFGAAL